MNRPICLAMLVVCLALSSLRVQANWYRDTQSIMGTRVHVEFYLAGDEGEEHGAELLDAVMREMRRIDLAFSSYRRDSELSMVNRQAPHGWVEVSDEMMELIEKAHRISELSQGAFDITYASVGRYYDYRAGEAPASEIVQQAIKAIDYRFIERDRSRQRIRFKHPEVYIALGGIAKGHAVDRGIGLLRRAGITQASLSAGGDSRIIGDRHGKPWNVGIKHPREEGGMSAILPLRDTAISTSGDYERYFEQDGVRFHHILDPATGHSAKGAWSVTVLGPEATLTDGLSTSVFVLGAEKGMALVNRLPGIDAIIIDPGGRLLYSEDLSPLSGLSVKTPEER